MKFNLNAFRASQYKQLRTPNLLSFISTYRNFDMYTNSTVVAMDRYGVSLINLQTKELFQMQVFED